jgi:hypothetical protein
MSMRIPVGVDRTGQLDLDARRGCGLRRTVRRRRGVVAYRERRRFFADDRPA